VVTKKDLVIAILSTFCLTAALFIIIPTRSSPGIGEYDPWVDLNDDGTINILDCIIISGAFGTSGDPTKNVNVTNWPEWLKVGNVTVTNFPLDEQGNLRVSMKEGYYELKIFPETIVLRGLCFAWPSAEEKLLDDETPIPEGTAGAYENSTTSTEFTTIYDRRFIYEKYPMWDYFIQGDVLVRLKCGSENFGTGISQFRGIVYFEKVLTNGTVITIAATYIPEAFVGDYNEAIWNVHLVFSFETPIIVNKGERIAVRVHVEAKRDTATGIYWRLYMCTPQSPTSFMVMIPMGT